VSLVFLSIDGFKYEFEKEGSDDGAEDGGEDIDPEPAADGIRQSCTTPSSQIGHKSRTKISGGIKAGLREWRHEENDARDGETDEQRLQVGRGLAHVTVLRQAENEENKHHGAKTPASMARGNETVAMASPGLG